MNIKVKSRHGLSTYHLRQEKLRQRGKQIEEALLIDVTSRGPEPWVRFSPFYPHLNIPVPFTQGCTAASVEGIWQALKVFERADVDEAILHKSSMRGLKRTVRKYGTCIGHRRGLEGVELLDYRTARYQIYLPTYRWVLEHCLADELEQLRQLAQEQPMILWDYETNCDVDNLNRPLSHAGLMAAYLKGHYPV